MESTLIFISAMIVKLLKHFKCINTKTSFRKWQVFWTELMKSTFEHEIFRPDPALV